MFKRYYITSLLLITLPAACDNNLVKSSSNKLNKTQILTSITKKDIDNEFNDFIEKFSTDSIFQLSRIKFPLKTKYYDSDNNKYSVIYHDKPSSEMMDFRKKKSIGEYDQWEQKIIIDKNNTSATIEIRGIDNGIMVDYLFEKINGAWVLIELDNKST